MIYVNRSGGICRTAEIEKALAYVRENGAVLADGKTFLNGDKLYVSIQSYKTKARGDCKYEAHRRYIDIQYIIEGREIIAVTDAAGLRERAPYSEEKDVVFFEDDKKGTEFELHAGTMWSYSPRTCTCPRCARVSLPTSKKRLSRY